MLLVNCSSIDRRLVHFYYTVVFKKVIYQLKASINATRFKGEKEIVNDTEKDKKRGENLK